MRDWGKPIDGKEIRVRGISVDGGRMLFDLLIAGIERKLLAGRLELKFLESKQMTPDEIVQFAEHLTSNPDRKEFLIAAMEGTAEPSDTPSDTQPLTPPASAPT